jgi:predicted nuclease of predicted toxin-antitoxin system
MKLLVDMNLSPRWVPLLRDAGWETTHWSSIGKGDEPDSEIMSYAAKYDYVVLTHDWILARFSRPPAAKNRVSHKCGQGTSARKRPLTN